MSAIIILNKSDDRELVAGQCGLRVCAEHSGKPARELAAGASQQGRGG